MQLFTSLRSGWRRELLIKADFVHRQQNPLKMLAPMDLVFKPPMPTGDVLGSLSTNEPTDIKRLAAYACR